MIKWSRWYRSGVGIVTLAFMSATPVAGAESDLDVARRAFCGAQPVLTEPADRKPATSVTPTSTANDRLDLKPETNLVQEAIKRTAKITEEALANHKRDEFEARLNASIAGVNALLNARTNCAVQPLPIGERNSCMEERP